MNPGAVATTTRIDQNKSGFDLEYVKRNQKKQYINQQVQSAISDLQKLTKLNELKF